jgi:hypothetical protein
MIFVNSMSDLFQEGVPDDYSHKTFESNAEATKRKASGISRPIETVPVRYRFLPMGVECSQSAVLEDGGRRVGDEALGTVNQKRATPGIDSLQSLLLSTH